MIAQNGELFRSSWLPDEKTSAKRISCITYTRTQQYSANLPSMIIFNHHWDLQCAAHWLPVPQGI
jgi:hypothetical protein